jgi:predicted membrane-bound mannosyltransferase
MEMQLTLLVALTLACFWRYSQSGGRLWLIAGGCCLGFQHATKETFILNIAAAFAGWLVTRVLIGDFQPAKNHGLRLGSSSNRGRPKKVWLWVLLPATFVSIASYSGGFHDWKAVQDSLMSYANYFQRSDGSGHEKPWHYYLSLIFWRKDTLIWSEAMIGGLGLIGMIYAFVGEFKSKAQQAFLVFLSIYTLTLFFSYSILSYKTPWCILSAQYSLTLMAGAGAGWIWTWLSDRATRFVYKLALGLGVWHLCYLTSITTGSNAALPYEADSRNPYVYAHTSPNLLRLLDEVKKIRGERAPESQDIQVINQDSGWPLPWYWRAQKNVGYQTSIPEKLMAPIIIVDMEQLPAVKSFLAGRDYRERGPFGLRPGVLVSILVEKTYATDSKTVAPVHQDKPTPSLEIPEGTISTSPTLMPTTPTPVLPNMGSTIPKKR